MLGEHGRTSTKSLSSCCLVFCYVIFGTVRNDEFSYFYRKLLVYRFSVVIISRGLRVRVTWEVINVVAGKVSCKKLVFCFLDVGLGTEKINASTGTSIRQRASVIDRHRSRLWARA